MAAQKKIAFIFPGQGAQYCGMGKDFAAQYAIARQTFEEADDLLGRKLSKIAFEGPEDVLTETRNSQTAIYVNSMAILRTLYDLFPIFKPSICAGFSLGEYTALTCAGYLPFEACLPIVHYRGQYMNDACEERRGVMAAVIGLSADEVEAAVKAANLPNDLWVANFNCPGQTVISGTLKGVEVGGELLKERGAKRLMPLKVHGAFHSGLMRSAADRLAPHIDSAPIQKAHAQLVMNVPGDFVSDLSQVKDYLAKQVVSSVRWEQSIRAMQREGVEVYIEIGCGKTLAGMNKRIGVSAPTISIDKVEDLRLLEEQLVVLTT